MSVIYGKMVTKNEYDWFLLNSESVGPETHQNTLKKFCGDSGTYYVMLQCYIYFCKMLYSCSGQKDSAGPAWLSLSAALDLSHAHSYLVCCMSTTPCSNKYSIGAQYNMYLNTHRTSDVHPCLRHRGENGYLQGVSRSMVPSLEKHHFSWK